MNFILQVLVLITVMLSVPALTDATRNRGRGMALGSGNISLSITDPKVVRHINGSLIVSCSGPEGLVWLNPRSEKISSKGDRIHVESNHKKGVSLVLERIQLEDKGRYTCKSHSDNKLTAASFELQVIRPLSFTDTETEVKGRLFSEVFLRCMAMGDFNISTTWERNGTAIKGNRHYETVADGLRIVNATLEDEGEYVCRAFQISSVLANTLDRRVTVVLEHAPIWKEGEKNGSVFYGLVGGDTNLTCAVRAFPKARFEWLHNGRKLPENTPSFETDNVGILQLHVHDTSTFGNYTCKARNKHGEVQRYVLLQEGIKPDPPASITFEAHDGDSVSLEIEEQAGGSDEPDTIGYRVQYRTKGTNTTWDEARVLDFKKGIKPYRISGLVQNMDYEVRVATRNVAGYSDYSQEQSFKNPKAQAEHVSSPATARTGHLLLLVGTMLFCWP